MVKPVIPIRKETPRGPLPLIPNTLSEAHGRTLDRRQRPLRDLRISVTDLIGVIFGAPIACLKRYLIKTIRTLHNRNY